MAILDISTLTMFRFHYIVRGEQYKSNARLLMTDTDSLVGLRLSYHNKQIIFRHGTTIDRIRYIRLSTEPSSVLYVKQKSFRSNKRRILRKNYR